MPTWLWILLSLVGVGILLLLAEHWVWLTYKRAIETIHWTEDTSRVSVAQIVSGSSREVVWPRDPEEEIRLAEREVFERKSRWPWRR